PEGKTGTLAEALLGADVFIGVSKPGLVTKEMVSSMAPSPIIFALANPDPEILPADALAGGAAVVATGRSDYPNQVNNVLVYPGLFRGLLNRRAQRLTPAMKLAAARALAGMVSPTAEHILPSILEANPAEAMAQAVASV
ncbi:MAG: Malic enzyme, NAD binding domain protein, partial [Candidatus Uhrbacteria bacterium GW2011_GWD2_52_7]